MADRIVAERDERARRARAALAALARLGAEADDWLARAAEARTSWLVAEPLEPPDRVVGPPAPPAEHRVVAADGSQIFPDRHGPATCYLLNLGRVTLDYGAGARASLSARSELRFDEEQVQRGELGERRAVTPEEVGIERALREFETLLELAREPSDRPAVALADGTLIPWSWARGGDDPRLGRYLATQAAFEPAGVPVAGYLSRSGASDVVNLLRIGECDQRPTNCDRCPHLRELLAETTGRRNLTVAEAGRLPCGTPAGLCDADLFGAMLQYGQRSAVFLSRSSVYDAAPDQRVAFCYLNVGELARLEFPRWLLDHAGWLDRLHAVTLDQVAKGRGYPVALQEAHEQAVVRAADRDAFARLLERSLVRRGALVTASAKSRSKLRPGV